MKSLRYHTSFTGRSILMLLSCLVLCVSCLSPFFMKSNLSLSNKKAFYSLAAKQGEVKNDLGDVEDESDLVSDDDSDLIDDIQIHHFEFIYINLCNAGFPLLNDQILPKHFGELMVPPPQIEASFFCV